jgi:hypothetical protein
VRLPLDGQIHEQPRGAADHVCSEAATGKLRQVRQLGDFAQDEASSFAWIGQRQ